LQLGWIEVDDASFDVVACVDEGEGVGCVVGQGIGVAGVFLVENVEDGSEWLVFVGAADMFVRLDFSGTIC
jgi:hypothetical protein